MCFNNKTIFVSSYTDAADPKNPLEFVENKNSWTIHQMWREDNGYLHHEKDVLVVVGWKRDITQQNSTEKRKSSSLMYFCNDSDHAEHLIH